MICWEAARFPGVPGRLHRGELRSPSQTDDHHAKPLFSQQNAAYRPTWGTKISDMVNLDQIIDYSLSIALHKFVPGF